ncbi:hypothetical protein Bbelb_316500 [Branchiostoma belcheri]|nr:hypothetical protein Bbelb_316500 [Branchiostoma belcheri]
MIRARSSSVLPYGVARSREHTCRSARKSLTPTSPSARHLVVKRDATTPPPTQVVAAAPTPPNLVENCNYTSEEIMWEMVLVLSDGPREEVFSTLQRSPYYSIMIDETTDISVAKQLIIFDRYLTDKHEVRTSYLGIRDIPDGKADTIVEKLKEFLRFVRADPNIVAGFDSDGAAVIAIVNSKDNCVKLKQVKDVRWLCHHLAVTALRRTYPAVVMSLEREAVERNEAAAKGLAVFLKTHNFISSSRITVEAAGSIRTFARICSVNDSRQPKDIFTEDYTRRATLEQGCAKVDSLLEPQPAVSEDELNHGAYSIVSRDGRMPTTTNREH